MTEQRSTRATATDADTEPRRAGESSGRRNDGDLPNFIVVFCDDLGYGDLSSYGSQLVRTPTVDGMAQRGMRFTDMYVGAQPCSPSRASLLTGCYAPRVNIPLVLFPEDKNGIGGQETTLAEYFKRADYATACIGKWHLGARAEHHPLEHGFDRFFGLPYSNDMSPLPLYDDREVIEEPAEQDSLTRRYHERSVEFVRDNADRPFFLYLAHTQPHEPLASEFEGRSAAGPHGDAVEEIDHYLGLLLEELDTLGVREDTCVIFTSDNGPWYVGSAGDLYGRKTETYEGGQRCPFVIEWPGVVPAGTTYIYPACLVDLLPTLLAAIGLTPEPDRTLDGRDIGAALMTGEPVERGDVYYYNETCNAVRSGNWKLHVRRVGGPDASGRMFSETEELPQLFDLARDPEESYDLSEHNPEVTDGLRRRLTEFDDAVQDDRDRRYERGSA